MRYDRTWREDGVCCGDESEVSAWSPRTKWESCCDAAQYTRSDAQTLDHLVAHRSTVMKCQKNYFLSTVHGHNARCTLKRLINTKQVGVVAMLYSCILEVLSSDLSHGGHCLSSLRFLVVLFQPLHKTPGISPQLYHNHFLPNPLQFIYLLLWVTLL
jgi:hypothetical protein